MNNKKHLFTLSKKKGDFVVQSFKGSGKGGQKRNKTMSSCRIYHPASKVISECQEERSFEVNKKKAFLRLTEKPEFKKWYKLEVAKQLGRIADINEEVKREMKNIRIEIIKDGQWIEEKLVNGD